MRSSKYLLQNVAEAVFGGAWLILLTLLEKA